MNDEQLVSEMITAVEETIRNNMKDQFDSTKQSVIVKTAAKEIISILAEKINSEVENNEDN